MAQFNNKDQRNLEELIEEGLMDRLKARGAEALGSAKGLGQQLKGAFKQAAGSALSKAGDFAEIDRLSRKGEKYTQQGQQSSREGMVSGYNAKIEYLQKNIEMRIQSFVDDIKNDIKKLDLDIGNIEIVSGINDALNQLKKSVSGATPPPLPRQSVVAPPPLPKQQASEPDKDKPKKTKYSYKKAISRRKKSQPTVNPRKGKVRKDPSARYLAPEDEEDLEKMFWDY